jgi:hypothetical protein
MREVALALTTNVVRIPAALLIGETETIITNVVRAVAPEKNSLTVRLISLMIVVEPRTTVQRPPRMVVATVALGRIVATVAPAVITITAVLLGGVSSPIRKDGGLIPPAGMRKMAESALIISAASFMRITLKTGGLFHLLRLPLLLLLLPIHQAGPMLLT